MEEWERAHYHRQKSPGNEQRFDTKRKLQSSFGWVCMKQNCRVMYYITKANTLLVPVTWQRYQQEGNAKPRNGYRGR